MDLTCDIDNPRFIGAWGGGSQAHKLETLPAGRTGGVSRVDDAEDPRVAALPGLGDGSLELRDIQAPAVVLVQVVVDLHGPQVGQGGRVQGVLGNGDQHSRSVAALSGHQQLQNGLWGERYQGAQL